MNPSFSRSQASVRIVSHACALVSVGDIKILSDPWLFGSVFNSGWSLLLKKGVEGPLMTADEVKLINHLYISHEHPDHFHIPSLKWIANCHPSPESIKILIKNDARTRESIAPVLKKLGFSCFCFLGHGERKALSESISAEIYLHRHIDSALLLFDSSGPFLINLNDAELSHVECTSLRRRYGPIPLVLNQFSIAGFDGVFSKELLRLQASTIIDKMILQHKSLSSTVTLPFASFCWFSAADNSFLNEFHNTLNEVYSRFVAEGLCLYCLEPPSDVVDFTAIMAGSRPPSSALTKKYPQLDPNVITGISSSDLVGLVKNRCASLFSFSNNFLTYLTDPLIIFYIPDRDITIHLNIRSIAVCSYPGFRGRGGGADDGWYIRVNSQPLAFAFGNTFGVQTLGVSGRYQLVGVDNVPLSWKLIRILSSLDNNKTPLRISTLSSPDFYKFVFDRGILAARQVSQQFFRFLNS